MKAHRFDTTTCNTGTSKGTCHCLEQQLEKSLLYLACRHHIFEIVIQDVKKKNQGTVGPEVPLLKNFQSAWSKIKKTKFTPGTKNKKIFDLFLDYKEKILKFLREVLNITHTRDDYKEFLGLRIIFLSESPCTMDVQSTVYHEDFSIPKSFQINTCCWKQCYQR